MHSRLSYRRGARRGGTYLRYRHLISRKTGCPAKSRLHETRGTRTASASTTSYNTCGSSSDIRY